MNSLANKTVLVALALTLWGTSSMAAAVELSTANPAEQDTLRGTVATAPAPLYALTRLNAQSLAAQAMTDQELKAVEGGLVGGCGYASMRPITIVKEPKITTFTEFTFTHSIDAASPFLH